MNSICSTNFKTVLTNQLLQILYIGSPKILRADRGTENGSACTVQRMFRGDCEDSFAGEKSFMYGASTANQVRVMCYVGLYWFT